MGRTKIRPVFLSAGIFSNTEMGVLFTCGWGEVTAKREGQVVKLGLKEAWNKDCMGIRNHGHGTGEEAARPRAYPVPRNIERWRLGVIKVGIVVPASSPGKSVTLARDPIGGLGVCLRREVSLLSKKAICLALGVAEVFR